MLSDSRMLTVSRWDTACRSWSPTPWPSVSFTSLNPSRSMNRAATDTEVRRARANICSVRSRIRARLGSPVNVSCTAWKRIWSTSRALEMAMEAWAARPLSCSVRPAVTERRSGSSMTLAVMKPIISPVTTIGAVTVAAFPSSTSRSNAPPSARRGDVDDGLGRGPEPSWASATSL